jgi:hypothetical protein
MATFCPTTLLTSVDLPTFGRPTTLTNPVFISMMKEPEVSLGARERTQNSEPRTQNSEWWWRLRRNILW